MNFSPSCQHSRVIAREVKVSATNNSEKKHKQKQGIKNDVGQCSKDQSASLSRRQLSLAAPALTLLTHPQTANAVTSKIRSTATFDFINNSLPEIDAGSEYTNSNLSFSLVLPKSTPDGFPEKFRAYKPETYTDTKPRSLEDGYRLLFQSVDLDTRSSISVYLIYVDPERYDFVPGIEFPDRLGTDKLTKLALTAKSKVDLFKPGRQSINITKTGKLSKGDTPYYFYEYEQSKTIAGTNNPFGVVVGHGAGVVTLRYADGKPFLYLYECRVKEKSWKGCKKPIFDSLLTLNVLSDTEEGFVKPDLRNDVDRFLEVMGVSVV